MGVIIRDQEEAKDERASESHEEWQIVLQTEAGWFILLCVGFVGVFLLAGVVLR